MQNLKELKSTPPKIIRSDGEPLPPSENLTPVQAELMKIFSSIQQKTGMPIPDLNGAGPMEIIRALAGLKNMARERGLKYIAEHFTESLNPTVDMEDAPDLTNPVYLRNLNSGAPSQKFSDPQILSSSSSPSYHRSSTPIDPLKATQLGECFRAFVFIVALLGLLGVLGWDFVMEFLQGLG